MSSYKERLSTFNHWPESHTALVKRLAILGQYSTSPETLSTACVFCKAQFTTWDPTDTPFLVHLRQNTMKCPLFRLQYVAGRKALISGHPDAEKYIDRKFIQLNITERAHFFCMRCGATTLAHECDGKVQRITENIDMRNAQFYIRYLNGEYVEQADAYIGSEVHLKADQKAVLEYLLSMEKKPLNGLEPLETFLERSAERVFQEVERKMKSMEANAVEQMYNESMML